MGGELQKTLIPVLGTPMVRHVFSAVSGLKPEKTFIVVGVGADDVMDLFPVPAGRKSKAPGPEFVLQKKQLGTGHALACAFEKIYSKRADVLVINGDMPVVTSSLLKRFVSAHRKTSSVLSLVTAFPDNPHGYGRIVRSTEGNVERIVEHSDADGGQRKIGEVNAGIYCIKLSFLSTALGSVGRSNSKGEYYITDLVEMALKKGGKVTAVQAPDAREVSGVNTPTELAVAQVHMKEIVNSRLLSSGVIITDPATCYICPQTKVGKGTVVHPFTFIKNSSIGRNCSIGPGSEISGSRIGANCKVEFSSSLDGCEMRPGSVVGPFARIRPGAVFMEDSRAGAFVEVKKSSIGKKSKVPHLSYIGDSSVGSDVNIGAGTITCNYDGFEKHRTTIGSGAFIGSDTMLVAPVRVGSRAVTAAGSVVTRDVSPDSLAVSRSAQKEIKKWRRRGSGGKD